MPVNGASIRLTGSGAPVSFIKTRSPPKLVKVTRCIAAEMTLRVIFPDLGIGVMTVFFPAARCHTMHRVRSSANLRLLAVGLMALLAGCTSSAPPAGAGDGGSPRPAPAAGTIMGRLVSQRSDGSHQTPIVGQVVGVFRQVVIAGKPLQHPPSPIITAMTTLDGSFAFHGLRPGSYFVTVAGESPPSVGGRWVRLSSSRGASLLLIHCTNCPPGPL
jgi:hypothetical protein